MNKYKINREDRQKIIVQTMDQFMLQSHHCFYENENEYDKCAISDFLYALIGTCNEDMWTEQFCHIQTSDGFSAIEDENKYGCIYHSHNPVSETHLHLLGAQTEKSFSSMSNCSKFHLEQSESRHYVKLA